MKAWRARSSSGGGFGSSSSPSVAHIVSVVTNGGTSVAWTFDKIVAAIGDVAGTAVDGEVGNSLISGLGTTTILIDYVSSHNPGDAWIFDASIAALTFSPASSISNDAGIAT